MSEFTPSFKIRLDKLHALIETTQDELKRLRIVYGNFPDIKVHHSARRSEIYCSPCANIQVTDFDKISSCGILTIRPFLWVNGFQIYSDPPELQLAYTSEDYEGYEFIPNYLEILVQNNISEVVIDKIKAFQAVNLPEIYDDLEENE